MSTKQEGTISTICESFGNDRSRMMDIVLAVQESFGCIDGAAMEIIAAATGSPLVEVEGVVSFYAFTSEEPVQSDEGYQVDLRDTTWAQLGYPRD